MANATGGLLRPFNGAFTMTTKVGWFITTPEGLSDGPFDDRDMALDEASIANSNYLLGWDTWAAVYIGPNGPEYERMDD